MTKGRASYSMEFECYREVPKHAQEIILRAKKSEYSINLTLLGDNDGKRCF